MGLLLSLQLQQFPQLTNFPPKKRKKGVARFILDTWKFANPCRMNG